MKCVIAGMARVLIISVLFIAFSGKGYCQDIAPQNIEKLKIMEDSLVVTADSMFQAFIPDVRVGYSERFVRQLVRALKIPGSAFYRFDSLGKLISIIYADDNAFRMFNWEITPNNITKRYYGAIQMPSEQLKLYGLLDYSEQLGNGAEDSVLTGGKWFGALYYRIMSVDVQGQKVYTLFGYNGSAQLTSRKVLDALTFTDRGVRFGAPIFGVASRNFPKQRVARFILEYKKGVQASMNWDSTHNVIIFDKLVSLTNDPGRKYTYAPSGGYDGFRWQNGNWAYLQDLIPVQVMREGEEPPQK
jgi:hypothetical protein